MKRYSAQDKIPLKWYNFQKYLLIFGSISNVVSLMLAFDIVGEYAFSLIDVFFHTACTVLIILATIGMFIKAWAGPMSLFFYYGASVLYGVVVMVILEVYYANLDASGDAFVTAGSSLIAFIPNFIYYSKRKVVFGKGLADLAINAAPLPVAPPPPTEKTVASIEFPREKVVAAAERLAAQVEQLNATQPKIAPPAAPPPFESSLDLLSQLRDECEQEQSQKEPQTVIVRRGPPKWVTALLVCLCVASLTGCGILGYFLKTFDAEFQTLSADHEHLKSELQRVESEFQRKKRDYSMLQTDYLDLVEENSEDAAQRLRNAIDLASYMVRVGFIVDGSSYYHTVNCSVMRNASEYQARNREYCERLGYKSCPDCH